MFGFVGVFENTAYFADYCCLEIGIGYFVKGGLTSYKKHILGTNTGVSFYVAIFVLSDLMPELVFLSLVAILLNISYEKKILR